MNTSEKPMDKEQALKIIASIYSKESDQVKEALEALVPEIGEGKEEETLIRRLRNFIFNYPNKLEERDEWIGWLNEQIELCANRNNDGTGESFSAKYLANQLRDIQSAYPDSTLSSKIIGQSVRYIRHAENVMRRLNQTRPDTQEN